MATNGKCEYEWLDQGPHAGCAEFDAGQWITCGNDARLYVHRDLLYGSCYVWSCDFHADGTLTPADLDVCDA